VCKRWPAANILRAGVGSDEPWPPPMPVQRVWGGSHVLRAFGKDSAPAESQVREAGYAISLGERDPDIAAIAIPVLDRKGTLYGALSVSGIITRFTEERRSATLQACRNPWQDSGTDCRSANEEFGCAPGLSNSLLTGRFPKFSSPSDGNFRERLIFRYWPTRAPCGAIDRT
jgi:hypothetical protein